MKQGSFPEPTAEFASLATQVKPLLFTLSLSSFYLNIFTSSSQLQLHKYGFGQEAHIFMGGDNGGKSTLNAAVLRQKLVLLLG